MTNPSHFHSRQRRPLSGRPDTNNMDEKKDCGDFGNDESSVNMDSDNLQANSFVVEGGGGSSTISLHHEPQSSMTTSSGVFVGSDCIVERQSTSRIGYLSHQDDDVSHQQQGITQVVDHDDFEDVRRNIPTTTTTTSATSGNNNGLHHRHHFHQSPFSPDIQLHHHAYLGQQTSSPNRRRRGRSRGHNMDHHSLHHHSHSHSHPHHPHHSRRRKWTAMQVFRSSLLAGAALYFVVMLRGTQILMQQNDASDESQEPTRGRLVDYFPLQLPAGYVSHPAIQGYLRSASNTIESLAPFIHKSTNDAPEVVKRAIKERLTERRNRTRPPAPQQQAADISNYVIVPAEKRPAQKHHHQQQQQPRARSQLSSAEAAAAAAEEEQEDSPTLATEMQLCGVHARQARKNNPESFLEKDALISSEAKVLITGIISNPLAFHLALTLKQRCGVEVLIGIDPLLPNTIQSRVQFMEQMQILASNAPKMQPILVPLLGLHPRVKKSKKESAENPIMLELTGELNLHMNFEPTHIVHLSAAMYQNPVSTNLPQSPMAPKRPLSPYQISKDDPYEPSLFQIRSSMMAMEQVLASVVSSMEEEGRDSAPHVTYASATTSRSASATNEDVVLSYSKLIDEVLADTYHDLFGAYSVGLRIPPNAIYGPWDTDTKLYKLLQEAINGNFTIPNIDLGDQALIYVQDAVDAIIGAMQYRESKATHFELNGNSAVSLSKVPSLAESLLTFKPTTTTSVEATMQHDNNDSERTLQKLHWKPGTTMRDGIMKTIAWLLDRASPFGPAPPTGTTNQPSAGSPPRGSGDALLLVNSVPTCPADDLGCHAGPAYLPCVSECSNKAECQPSIFDSAQQLTREMTEGCDAVLYTQSLGRDVEDLQLQSQFEDDMEPAICNIAFVAQSSPLVKAVIDKIPEEELQRLGALAPFNDKLKKLNGRLLYRGWILIWVDPDDRVSLADSSLMKLSPGRMFSEDVLYAVFVEENFTVSPTTDDVRFLISQMDRGATKQRNIYRMVKKEEHVKAKKVKFTIPAQPEKRSSILLSQLKFKISDRGRIPQDTKISIMDAVRFMRFEIGSDPTKQKESSAIKRQKDFYRRISTFINGKDLRDNFEPIYKYEIKHWVRTRWVVHDLTLEESRELRCDWYQEHVQWGSEIDQLSFAAVMARRILDRRMTLMEPDDRTKPKAPAMMELKDITDHNEWFAMATEHNKMHVSTGHSPSSVQEVIGDREEVDEDATEEGPDVPAGSGYYHEKKAGVGLYVRIISDRIMSLSRKAWARYRAEMAHQAGKP